MVNEVWEVISDNSSFNINDWKQILHTFCKVDCKKYIQEIHTWDVIWNMKEEVEFIKTFLLKENISWERLKRELNHLNKGDIIRDLCERTYLTKGMFNYKILIKINKN